MDEELMEQVAKGDQGAFGQIILRHQQHVQNIAYRFLGTKEDAEDIAQEVFLRVYINRKKYNRQGTFSSYITTITINACIDCIRRTTKANFYPLNEVSCPCAVVPEEIYARKELSHILQKVLEELPMRQRLAFLLKTYTNLSYQEIGNSLDCSRVAVEGLIFRARQTLQKKLQPILKEREECHAL